MSEKKAVEVNDLKVVQKYINNCFKTIERTEKYNSRPTVMSGISNTTTKTIKHVKGNTIRYTDMNGLKGFENAKFGGIESVSSDSTSIDRMSLEYAIYLGEWDVIYPEQNKIVRQGQTRTFTGQDGWVDIIVGDNTRWLWRVYVGEYYTDVNGFGELFCNYFEISNTPNEYMPDKCAKLNNGYLYIRDDEHMRDWVQYITDLNDPNKPGRPLSIYYKTKETSEETINFTNTSYTAYKGGTETVIWGDNDYSSYGCANTITEVETPNYNIHTAFSDKAGTATNAFNDSDGNPINTTYYKKTDTVENAVSSVNALNDSDGNPINTTYYKKTDVIDANTVNGIEFKKNGDGINVGDYVIPKKIKLNSEPIDAGTSTYFTIDVQNTDLDANFLDGRPVELLVKINDTWHFVKGIYLQSGQFGSLIHYKDNSGGVTTNDSYRPIHIYSSTYTIDGSDFPQVRFIFKVGAGIKITSTETSVFELGNISLYIHSINAIIE